MEAPSRTGRSLNLPVFLAAALLTGAAASAVALALYEPRKPRSEVVVAPMQEHAPGLHATRVETLKPGPGPELRRALRRLDTEPTLDPALLQALEGLDPHPDPSWRLDGMGLGGLSGDYGL